MNKPKSEWQTKELAAAFLEGVRRAIPGADLQLKVINKIAQFWRPAPARIMDLGCGDGILGRFLLNIFPAATGVFVDFSGPMLDAARKNLPTVFQSCVISADFSTPQWLEAVTSFQPFDIVVSGFAIHHQPDDRKKALYSEIHNLLSPGGIFLNLEHIESATEEVKNIFDDFFVDSLYEFHSLKDSTAERDAIADTYYLRPDKKENLLAPMESQCNWLREIGFTDVDCFFKLFELAVFGGRRSRN
jgi:tRNA (cmo5U34)-methyltransferase